MERIGIRRNIIFLDARLHNLQYKNIFLDDDFLLGKELHLELF